MLRVPFAILLLGASASSQVYSIGYGHPGSLGEPELQITGSLTPQATVEMNISNALPGATASVILGFDTLYLPILGGILVPTPDVSVDVTISSSGTASFPLTWPGASHRDVLFTQCVVIDSGASDGLAFTGALEMRTERTLQEWNAFWQGLESKPLDPRDGPHWGAFLQELPTAGHPVSSNYLVQISLDASGKELVNVTDLVTAQTASIMVETLSATTDEYVDYEPLGQSLIVVTHGDLTTPSTRHVSVSILDGANSGSPGVFVANDIPVVTTQRVCALNGTIGGCFSYEDDLGRTGRLYLWPIPQPAVNVKALATLRIRDSVSGMLGPHQDATILCYSVTTGYGSNSGPIELITNPGGTDCKRAVQVTGPTGPILGSATPE